MAELKNQVATTVKRIKFSPQTTVILPNHLIYEHILLRLPVKPLIRFKSISKSFYSTISNPNFTKSHLHFSSSSPKFILLTTIDDGKLSLLHHDEKNNLHGPFDFNFNLDLQFQQERKSPQDQGNDFRFAQFVGSSNGLVCLYYRFCNCRDFNNGEYGFFFICNPATHQYCEITNPIFEKYANDYWFGYVPSIHDYLIVALFTTPMMLGHRLYVLSIRTGKWKRVCDHDEFNFCSQNREISKRTVVFNDVLYWSLKCPNNNETREVVGFDLVNEKLIKFQWMNWLNDYNATDFCVIKGCLSLVCKKSYGLGNDFIDIWMLNQNLDWSSWENLFSFRLSHMRYLEITPIGMFLLVTPCSDNRDFEIMIIDPNQDPLLEQPSGKVYARSPLGAGCYVESLIWPFGVIKATKEGRENEV